MTIITGRNIPAAATGRAMAVEMAAADAMGPAILPDGTWERPAAPITEAPLTMERSLTPPMI